MPKYDPGQKAPEFTVPSLNGDSIRLSDYRGNYLLLDFWGSWCGPCRQESPDLVSLYGQNKDKGFRILSIALDRDKASWGRAIAKDGLAWDDHGSYLKRMKDPVALLYGVREIPTKYLIDPNGDIIATNPTFAELNQTLNQVLTK